METFSWWIDESWLKGSANPSDEDLAQLRSESFRVGISLLEESRQAPRYDKQAALSAGWTIHSVPVPENHAPSIEQIHEFMARLTESLEGTKVVVFCQSGKGRTACMGAAYWIAQGLPASTAIERMTERCLDPEWPTRERRKVLQEYEQIRLGRSRNRS
jgi:protein-tyrosine phosphatase